MTQHDKKPIVILGGGFAGLRVARLLSRRQRELDRPIILIDHRKHHAFHALLYEVASGCTIGRKQEDEMIRAATWRFEKLLKTDPSVEFRQTSVASLDPIGQTVTMTDGTIQGYGTVVVALGAETEFYGIPGLKERSLELKTRQDALDIRRAVEAFIDRKHKGKEVELRILIGGGGATGVEFAAEMAGCFRAMERHGKLTRSDWEISIVEASPRLLGMLHPELSGYAKQRLEKLGVKVHLDTCVKRVDKDHVILAPRPLRPGEKIEQLVCDFRTETEKAVEADMVIWVGGIRGNHILKNFGVAIDQKDRIPVKPTLRTNGTKNLYVIGDCASLMDPKTKTPVPSLVEAALNMADAAVTQILADSGLKIARRQYKSRQYATAIPLGGKNAIVVMGGMTLTGFLAWIVRQLINLRYFMTIMPLRDAFHAFVHGSWLYIQND